MDGQDFTVYAEPEAEAVDLSEFRDRTEECSSMAEMYVDIGAGVLLPVRSVSLRDMSKVVLEL